MNIQIYSASAGTGKTTRLAELLEEALLGGARPEGILATTFTRQAATELQERARLQLLANGHVETAQMLGAARIGTVNAVAGQLVREHALRLGHSPNLRVLDEREAQAALAECMALQRNSPESQAVADLGHRLEELQSRDSALTLSRSVQRILELARSNGLAAEDLSTSCQLSVASLLTLLGPAAADGRVLEANLAAALQEFVSVLAGNTATQVSADAVHEAQQALHHLRSPEGLAWRMWAKLAHLKVAKRDEGAALALQHAAARHDAHPQLRADLQRVVQLTFTIAARAMQDYQAYKQQRGAIDFVDQEVLALQALEHPEVRDELRQQLDLVLVDEFQDTSPLQLALFLKLAELAPRSVWVGDQKQAIYSFRGTDPALMGAALTELEDGGNQEVLDHALASLQSARVVALTQSWRSRPALVQVTSQLFATAFAPHGMPRSLVEISAGHASEPAGLGPSVELWDLQLSNDSHLRELPQVAAHGVLKLLQDPTAQVRDRITGEARRLRPGDVGVLCRKNDTCQIMAQALAALGVPVQLARQGVLGTPEGQVLMAGLRLWLTPGAALPRAVLSRLLEPAHALEPARWLDAAMQGPGGTAFAHLPAVLAVERAAAVHGDQSAPLDVCVEACVEALGLRDVCRQWGQSAQRLANVEAMAALAQAYIQRCQGSACTLAGLLYHFETLRRAGQDMCGKPQSSNAVQVTTWHAAKGLEWPAVVLLGLEKPREQPTAHLGVRAESPEAAFNLQAPLHGRWIRFWTTPYLGSQKNTPFYERLQAHPLVLHARSQSAREALRLLYVGWTRARDRLVLALHDKEGEYSNGLLQPLSAEPMPRPEDSAPTLMRWAQTDLLVLRRRLTLPTASAPEAAQADAGYPPAAPRLHSPARSRPADATHTGRVVHRVQLGPRLQLRGQPNMTALGNAVHGFLALHLPHPGAAAHAQAHRLLQAWGVADHLTDADLVQASFALRAWVLAQWPEARWHTEVPLSLRLGSGTQQVGQADLLVHTGQGWVLFDHKVFPGNLQSAEQRAAAHSGQLAAYRAAVVAASAQPVHACYIHLPISGSLLEVAVD